MGKSRLASQRRTRNAASSGVDSCLPQALTASERMYMIRKAKEASVALVDHAHTLDGPVQWHYTGKFRGIQMYRGEGSYDHVGTAGTEFLCGVTTMMGTIEEVAAYFDQQTTEQMLAKKADDVLDCSVLYALVGGDPKNPFYRVSAKYQLYEGPSAFSRERDYCFLECQNTFRHASGRRGWVLSMHSIKLPGCPELEGVVRGSMYQSGYVFVQAEKEGYMDVMHSLQINFKSSTRLPHFLLNSALKRRIVSVVTISREIQSMRMGRQTLLKKKQLMPKRSRALCVICARKFSLFVRKTRCRVCGEVVCQPCAPQVLISTQRGDVKTRVCTKCYHLSPSDEFEPVGALPDSYNGAPSRRMQNVTRYSDILQDQHELPELYQGEDEDSMEEDGDEDGLEEQSDYSVFAQSRFTDASRDSITPSQFGASKFESHFEETSEFDATSEFDDSQYYDGGSADNSYVSATSTSYWKAGDSAASSIMGWNQASSVQPAVSYIYDPQTSTASSNLYGTRNYGSNYGGSNRSRERERNKKSQAAVAIPEDEPSSQRGYNISPNTSNSSSTEYKSTKYDSQMSDFKQTHELKLDPNYDRHNANETHESKTVSIQTLAKARSARYGIKSQFPPPPPPPLSPPPEEYSARKPDNSNISKHRKGKDNATRKVFTPHSSKEARREKDQSSADRTSRASRNMAFSAAVAERNARMSQSGFKDSRGFSNSRSSAILEQMRRNRGQASQHKNLNTDRSSALKSMEEEHLSKMREIERMQELIKEKAARRSTASSGSLYSRQSTQNDAPSRQKTASAAATKARQGQPHGNSGRSSGDYPPAASKTRLAAPGSPPGTPPSMRGRRLPVNASANTRRTQSSRGNRSRLTDDVGDRRRSFNRSSTNARVSLAPSWQAEDLAFASQRSGQRSSKASKSSLRSRNVDSSNSNSRHADDLAFDASQLSLDSTKFSSNFVIMETPDESLDHVAMMERPSAELGSLDSLKKEDLLNHSSVRLTQHYDSLRARAAFESPYGEERPSYELRRREEEHRKRMEELAKMTANHVNEYTLRDSSSTLGGLHDSAISLPKYSRNNFGDSTVSSVSSASSIDIDDEEFNFESRPLGRTKRSGTIPFALEELEHVPDVVDDDEVSEGPDDSDTSFRISEEQAEHEQKSVLDYEHRVSEGSVEVSPKNSQVIESASYSSDKLTKDEPEHDNESIQRSSNGSARSKHEQTEGGVTMSQMESESEQTRGLTTSPRRSSLESVENEEEREEKTGLSTPPFRPSDANSDNDSGFSNPPSRPSEESVEHMPEQTVELQEQEPENDTGVATPPRRRSMEDEHEQTIDLDSSSSHPESEFEQPNGVATPPRRSSVKSVESEHEQESGLATPQRRQSVESMESEHEENSSLGTPTRSQSVESVESDDEHANDFATLPQRERVESVESEFDPANDLSTPPRHSSVGSRESQDEHKSSLGTPPRRQSIESVESEREDSKSLGTPRTSDVESTWGRECELESASSREEAVKEGCDEETTKAKDRHSEESVENEREIELAEDDSRSENAAEGELTGNANDDVPAYRLSEASEKDDSAHSREESPPSDHTAKCSSNEGVARDTRSPKFQPESSQLVLGDGGVAVDEFFADSSSVISEEKAGSKYQRVASTIDEEYDSAEAPAFSNTPDTKTAEHDMSPRESCVSAIDEDLMNRPTNELFDMIRANRPAFNAGASQSSDRMHDLQASHLRRMEELNQIAVDHLGNRISSLSEDLLGSAFQPGRSLHPGARHDESQWRSFEVMEEARSKHLTDMERLRRRIRQLEEECRESIASVLTTEEMDVSEFDDEDMESSSKGFKGYQSFRASRSFNPQSSFMARSDLSASTISEHEVDMPLQAEEPLPARILLEQIAQLTQMQQAMAEADDEEDEEKYRERIKDQYRVLRSLRHERESLHRTSMQRMSVSEDEEDNWI